MKGKDLHPRLLSPEKLSSEMKGQIKCFPDKVLHGHKKENILHFVTVWLDLEHIMLSEIGQLEKNKYHMISLIGGI